MSGTITESYSITVENGEFEDSHSIESTVTQTTQAMWSNIVSVGTSEEDLTFNDLSTPGVILMLNLDPSNYVSFGPKSAGSMVLMGSLPANDGTAKGWTRFVCGSGVTLRWAANTAACRVLVKAYST